MANKSKLSNRKIAFSTFISGATVMIFEVVGARIIGPYFGTSMYVWTSVIGVILASLSLGYYFGGKRADNQNSVKEFASIFLFASGSILFVLITKDFLLNFVANQISDVRFAAIGSAILLFAIPSFFFGAVSPYAVKLSIKNVESAGETAGNIGAISTIGSIIGTFLGGFVLVPLFGANLVFLLCIILMLGTSLLLFSSSWSKALPILAVAMLVVFSSFKNAEQSNVKTYFSPYSTIMVYNQGSEDSATKVMRIDNHIGSSIFENSDELVYDYLKFYRLDKHVYPNFSKTLMLGGAACSYPKELVEKTENVIVDIVEIDKTLIDIAKQDFRVPETSRLQFFYEDGRTFVNRNIQEYDIIYIDAFNSLFSIPFQLTSIEFVEKIKGSLHQNGAVLVNILSNLNMAQNHFLRAEMKTYQQVFPYVSVFQVDKNASKNEHQNFCLVASLHPIPSYSADPSIQQFLQQKVEIDIGEIEVLTDNRAPVEFYINKLM